MLEGIETERSQQEIAWAAREWAAELADARPLILVFEDVHWAEEPLLELIEHLAERVKESPLMILCLARPELLDIRPGWGGGRLRAAAIELEPLAPAESEELLDALLADRELSTSERKTLLEKTEGNPLFVEETMRMLLEGGTSSKRIPDTLQAMIAARIDRLPRNEKRLAPARLRDRPHLLGGRGRAPAARRGRPRAGARRPAAARLRHPREPLVDHGRARLPVQARADPGRRLRGSRQGLAGRAPSAGGGLARRRSPARSSSRSAPTTSTTPRRCRRSSTAYAPPELAARAAAALEKAGRRALAREANNSARRLLVRAVELEPTLQRRFLAARAARRIADLPAQAVEMERVFADATEAGDTRLQGLALTALADNALMRDADLPRGRDLVEQALVLLEDGKPEDRYEALTMRARIGWWLGDLDDDERWIGKALEVAREIGRKDLEASSADDLASAAIARLDLDRAIRLVGEALELAEESGNITALGWALVSQARIDALRGRLDEAAAGLDRAEELFSQSGNAWALARLSNHYGWVERRRGDLPAADRRFRDAIRILKPLEDRGTLCESQRGLAQVLVVLKKIDEAERYALEARETVGPHDTISRATTRMALGIIRAAQGRDEEAETMLREAVAVVDGKDLLLIRRELVTALAVFLRERGRVDEAEEYEAELAGYDAALTPA